MILFSRGNLCRTDQHALLRELCVVFAISFLPSSFAAEDLVYRVPGMDRVQVRSNLVYKSAEGTDLKADLYLPQNTGSNAALPAVIFVLGDAPPDVLRNAKDWPCFHSYGRVAAASGFAGIAFNHRSSRGSTRLPEMHSDIAGLIEFVRANSAELAVDRNRLCLWFFSGSGTCLDVVMGTNATFVRCAVAYYPVLAPGFGVKKEIAREFSALENLKNASRMPPMFLVKAGLDTPMINKLIDDFRKAAEERRFDLVYLEHPQGRHAFDLLNDDDRSREIVRETMRFIQSHLGKPEDSKQPKS